MKKKLSYDSEEDVLYFNEGKKVQDSLDIGNIYVEFAGDNSVAGMEIVEASDTLSQMTGEEISQEDMDNIVEAKIKVHRSGEYAFIVLYFVVQRGEELVRESIGVNLPSNAVTA